MNNDNYKRIADNISKLLDKVSTTGRQEAMVVVEAAQFLQAIVDEKLIVNIPPKDTSGSE